MDKVVRTMHTRVGLLPPIGASTVTLEAAGAPTLEFLREHVPEARSVPLCGNSIGTDRRFLAAYLPDVENCLHYRSVDVSTIKELARRWYPEAVAGAPAKNGGHRALDDIRDSVAELSYFREHVFRSAPARLGPATTPELSVENRREIWATSTPDDGWTDARHHQEPVERGDGSRRWPPAHEDRDGPGEDQDRVGTCRPPRRWSAAARSPRPVNTTGPGGNPVPVTPVTNPAGPRSGVRVNVAPGVGTGTSTGGGKVVGRDPAGSSWSALPCTVVVDPGPGTVVDGTVVDAPSTVVVVPGGQDDAVHTRSGAVLIAVETCDDDGSVGRVTANEAVNLPLPAGSWSETVLVGTAES